MKEKLPSKDKFQRRIIASFTRHQMYQVLEWLSEQIYTVGNDPNKTISQYLENIEDEKKRERLEIGLLVLASTNPQKVELDDVREVLVWQTGPAGKDRMIGYKFVNPRGRPRRF